MRCLAVFTVLAWLALAAGAREHGDMLRDPEPAAFFMGFRDSALARAGIAIPFPQRDVHVRSPDAGAARSLRSGTKDAPDA